MAVAFAESDAEIAECFPVMAQLRPKLVEKNFIPTIRLQFAEGYKLAYIRHDKKVAAVAGFRILHDLPRGRFLYIDDLVTDEKARSKGLGGKLWDWIVDYARAEKCQRVDLTSGVQRFDAHRFYLNKRMHISSHHFTIELNP